MNSVLHPGHRCRLCDGTAFFSFVDLGMSPLCQTHLSQDQLSEMEPFYPLHAVVCENCFLVQLHEFVAPAAIFSEYAYFSSYSDSWVAHARDYAERMIGQLRLTGESLVTEVASNDGYLLQHFSRSAVPVLGIEPAANVAAEAVRKGVRTEVVFLGSRSALELRDRYGPSDLLIGNNVLAHVPALNDFIEGLRILLKPDGVLTLEFPHLQRLIEGNQFDTIYHEHFSYFSFHTACAAMSRHGLQVFDVEELPTHGGSLRLYVKHAGNESRPETVRCRQLLDRELSLGFLDPAMYRQFGERVKDTKRRILKLLIELKQEGAVIAGYGAPGKGNTLLNYCGIRSDFLDYTVDRNPYKQGKFTPGTHIPILDPSQILRSKPDYVLILPWNLRNEVIEQLQYVSGWGGKFIVPIPVPQIVSP